MIKKLKNKISQYFKHESHGFDHTERVYNLAVKIATKEKADMSIIKAAALLHDIGRSLEYENKELCHAEESAKMAPKILKSINFPKQKVLATIHCILVHRYSKGLKPETKEAKIIQDADRLDCLGTLGIARVFTRGGEKNRQAYDPNNKQSPKTSIGHFYQKILILKPKTFHTKTAQEMAKKRYEYTEEFVQRFEKEWSGQI